MPDLNYAELSIGDQVQYRGQLFEVAGISQGRERPVALVNPEDPLDRGCVQFDDLERLAQAGSREHPQSSQKSTGGYWDIAIGLVGKGKPVHGVYVTQRDGVVTADQDGNPVSEVDPHWNDPEDIVARREASKPADDWWNGFKE